MNAYEKVEACRKKHPKISIRDAAKATQVAISNYYHHKAVAEGRNPRNRKKVLEKNYHKLIAETPVVTSENKVMLVVCTPAQLRDVLREGLQ